MEIERRPLRREDRAEIAAVVARAFWNDPLVGLISRDLAGEHRNALGLFDPVVRDLLEPGSENTVVTVDGRPRALAGWFPPGTKRGPRRDLMMLARVVRRLWHVRNRALGIRLFLEVEKLHPHDDHWYLALLATDPSMQGRGLGTRLITPILERCDETAVPAYLETQLESNLSWYGRFGFEEVAKVQLSGGPPIWCLRREPREPGTGT
jgi:GNAT superfamily N-acetyltransferase